MMGIDDRYEENIVDDLKELQDQLDDFDITQVMSGELKNMIIELRRSLDIIKPLQMKEQRENLRFKKRLQREIEGNIHIRELDIVKLSEEYMRSNEKIEYTKILVERALKKFSINLLNMYDAFNSALDDKEIDEECAKKQHYIESTIDAEERSTVEEKKFADFIYDYKQLQRKKEEDVTQSQTCRTKMNMLRQSINLLNLPSDWLEREFRKQTNEALRKSDRHEP